ncbi:MAG TPA: Eco57I restriction-modification methylase domain-containing protein, partial [Candidatus Hypogeohydataceae bacterium YC40]
DASLRPDKKNPLQGLILKLKYTEYLDNLEKLLLLSKEAVGQGSLERLLLRDAKSKRQKIPVDKSFLQDMSLWREELAKDVYKHNPDISVRTLNEVVQKLLDRIVFIRIAEDRNIIKSRTLFEIAELWKAEGKKRPIQYHLNNLFREINADLNGDIFKSPHACEQYEVDSHLLAEIIEALYFPNSPYLFDVIGVELLGSIYERYLGSTIRVTPGGRVKVEEKPEVRKAGGVYYTPQYIVKYIVENTVGKLVEGKTPKQIEKIKILDPACGSGSFLLGAYKYIIDYHIKYYRDHPKEAHVHPLFPDLISGGRATPDEEGNYMLSIIKKGHILRNNIFGVDIDPQAVEITMMSLYLKALEGERTLPRKQGLLPVLSDNIKCGNSLIGYDIFDQGQLFTDEEKERINPFDWNSKKAGFGKIMERGGFDCVIGNPPYGFHQIHSNYEKQYFKKYFKVSQGSFEHYFLFYEKSLGLIKKNGMHGFIVPVTWLTIPSARSLRKLILNDYWIKEICYLPELVFANAKVNTLISIIQNWKYNNVLVKIYDSLGFQEPAKEECIYKQSEFIKADYFIGIFEKKLDRQILKKISILSRPLKEIARPCSGYNPYEVGKGQAPKGGLQTAETVKTKPYHAENKLSDEWKPEVVGRDLGRYSLNITGKRWIKYGPWLAAPRDPKNFLGKRILVQEITGGKDRRIVASYCDQELYHSRDVIPIKLESELSNPLYLLGIINSWLITWYHYKRNPKAKKELFPKVLVSDLEKLPIRTSNFDDPKEKAMHDRLVSLVDHMLEVNKKKHALPATSEREAVEREIAVTDEHIDDLVYELYGITEEERKIIEGAG